MNPCVVAEIDPVHSLAVVTRVDSDNVINIGSGHVKLRGDCYPINKTGELQLTWIEVKEDCHAAEGVQVFHTSQQA